VAKHQVAVRWGRWAVAVRECNRHRHSDGSIACCGCTWAEAAQCNDVRITALTQRPLWWLSFARCVLTRTTCERRLFSHTRPGELTATVGCFSVYDVQGDDCGDVQ
jgi:hypothetical protein